MAFKLTDIEQSDYRRLVLEVDELFFNKGMTKQAAICAAGCGTGTYYNQKKRDGVPITEHAGRYYHVDPVTQYVYLKQVGPRKQHSSPPPSPPATGAHALCNYSIQELITALKIACAQAGLPVSVII